MAGVVTTAGCRALATIATPAERDAPLLREIRRRRPRARSGSSARPTCTSSPMARPGQPVVGHLAATRAIPPCIPGGSSSGSATAVAAGEAVVALGLRHRRFGTDPGRVLRHRRVEDDLGPGAADRRVAARAEPRHRRPDGCRRRRLVLGMQLLEPDFATGDASGVTIGRVRVDFDVNPAVDAAVDRALADSGRRHRVELPMWRRRGKPPTSCCRPRLGGPTARCSPSIRRASGLTTAERIARRAQIDLQAEAAARRSSCPGSTSCRT